MRRPRGCLSRLLWLFLLGGTFLYAITALTEPWALHMGGRPTPLFTWWGSGTLIAKGGLSYPLFVCFYPTYSDSQPATNGQRLAGNLLGYACLCSAKGGSESLQLHGSVYGGWLSAADSLMELNVGSRRIVNVGQKTGYILLRGRWQSGDLVLDGDGTYSTPFRSGLKIGQASLRLHPTGFWLSCENVCASSSPR